MLKSVVANNNCGFIGGNYSAVRYSFLPGELSTVQFRYGSTKAFNFEDLPCPPESVRYANGWNDGDCTYQPFLAPMTQILNLDPAFKECWVPGCGLWDPPHALTPQGTLWVTTTPADSVIVPPTPQPQVTPETATYTSMFEPSLVSSLVVNPQPSQSLGGGLATPSRGSSPDSPSNPSPGPSPSDPAQNPDPQGNPTPGSHSNPVDPQPTSTPTPGIPLTIGTNTVVFHTSSIVIGTNTILPGSAPVTVSGTPVSLAPSASAVIIGSSVIVLPTANPAPNGNSGGTPPAPGSQVVTIGGATLTPTASSQLVVGTQTLTPGGAAVTVSGTTYSLPSAGSSIIVNGNTVALPSINPALSTPGSPSPIASQVTIAAGSSSYDFSVTGTDLVISGQTLVPGGSAVTIGGTVMSLPSGGGQVVIGSSTIPLAQTTVDVGGVIYTAWAGPTSSESGAVGPTATASVMGNGTIVILNTGDARKLNGGGLWWLSLALGLVFYI
jgi:hypothetical protein